MRHLLALAALIAVPAYGQTYGPPDTVEVPPRYDRITAPPSQSDRDCVRKWRGRALLAHAADAATTVAAIETGKGREGNPLARLAFGKNVTTAEFLAFKAGAVGHTRSPRS